MRSFFRTASIILLVLWMGVIFYMSAQPASVSSAMSGGFIEVIAEKFYPNFETLSQYEQTEIIASFQFVVRKAAHIGSFAILGFLSFLSFVSYRNLRFSTRLIFSTLVSVVYAASDEFHQKFVIGRSCELRDFLLDTAGIVGALLITVLFIMIIPPLRRKTAYINKNKKLLNEDFTLESSTELSTTESSESYAKNKDKEEIQIAILQQQEIIDSLTASLNEKNAEIKHINSQLEECRMRNQNNLNLSDDFKFAATAIGTVTVEVTKVCNKILCDTENPNAKELVNLVLGKNEIFKVDVLNILNEKIDFSEKQKLIEQAKLEAFDYFNSILAQNC